MIAAPIFNRLSNRSRNVDTRSLRQIAAQGIESMSQWTERITSHPAYTEIEALEATLALVRKEPAGEGESVASIERASTVVERCSLIMRTTDASLIPPSVPAAILGSLQNAQLELRGFLSDHNPAHINNANTYLDPILVQLGQIPYGSPKETLAGAKASVEAFRATAARALDAVLDTKSDLSQQIEKLKVRVEELLTEIATQKVRLDTAISQQQQQFSLAEDSRRGAFATAEKERAETVRAEAEGRDTAFEGEIDKIRLASSALTEGVTDTFTQLTKRFDANSEDLSHQMQAHLERARDIVGIISESGMVHGYSRVANEEKATATRWHWIAGVSMVGLIAFAIFAFLETLGGGFNWGTFGGRAFVALTFGILAAYAARQADKHEQVERRSRRLELELAALDPFLEPLPEPDRIAVKKLMADRLFGQPDLIPNALAENSSGTLFDLLKLAIQSLAKR